MDFEIGLIFVMGYLFSISKSQTMMHVYYSAPGQEFRRYYTISPNHLMKGLNIGQSFTYPPYGTPMTLFWYPTSSYYSTINYIPKTDISPGLSKNILFHKNIFPSYHGIRQPKLSTPKDPKKNGITPSDERDFARGIFFDEYPHLKSLLRNQKLRLDNKLQPYKFGSLRPNFPDYRP